MREIPWSSGSNHVNDDVTISQLYMHQLAAVADQPSRWYSNISAGNCSYVRRKQEMAEKEQLNANWRRNCTRTNDEEYLEFTIHENGDVTDTHHQVAHALHWASTVILGLLVLEVRNVYSVCFQY